MLLASRFQSNAAAYHHIPITRERAAHNRQWGTHGDTSKKTNPASSLSLPPPHAHRRARRHASTHTGNYRSRQRSKTGCSGTQSPLLPCRAEYLTQQAQPGCYVHLLAYNVNHSGHAASNRNNGQPSSSCVSLCSCLISCNVLPFIHAIIKQILLFLTDAAGFIMV